MKFPPWQQRVYAQACEAIDADRLAHGMLFCGPAQLGKCAVAERLTQRLLCTARSSDGEPCGHCRSCQLLSAGTHPDYRFISFVMNKEGTRLRTEIVIEQIRELSEKLTLTPQYGGAQVVILAPADAINHAACNALLKRSKNRCQGAICGWSAPIPRACRPRSAAAARNSNSACLRAMKHWRG